MRKWFLVIVIIILLLGNAFLIFGFLLPLCSAESQMHTYGQMILEQHTDGKWELSWPAAEGVDFYRVDIFQNASDSETTPRLIFRDFSDEPSLTLPELPAEKLLTFRICSAVKFNSILGCQDRYSDNFIEATVNFSVPQIDEVNVSANAYDQTVQVDVQKIGCPLWQYQLVDTAGNILEEQTTSDTSIILQFGENASYKEPESGMPYRLHLRACYIDREILILGVPVEDIIIAAEDLQFPPLNPVLTEERKNTIVITWDETIGTYYEVQQWNQATDEWNIIEQVPNGEKRAYAAQLEPEKEYQYRIVSKDGQGKCLVTSETLTFESKSRVQYATIWPTKDLPAYSNTDMEEPVATATTGSAYCVLKEEAGMFAVKIDDQVCYIDSNYCMINLPEYLGDLCSYKITNSFYSIYAVHEFGIPTITGTVIAGYEDICQEDGSFLVPLLYPTAKMLLSAAQTAEEQGYRIKIYDSFRPYKATRKIYDVALLYMDSPIPDKTYTGVSKSTLRLPAPEEGENELTYGWLMTGARYNLSIGSFLAKNSSMHNYGVALDLTLEEIDTGEEICMQTSMHDLSQYSVTYENNDAAKILYEIMHGAGFTSLATEWWHFQDNQSRNDLKLTPVTDGVNAECWVKDDIGWKYRGAKGNYFAGVTVMISGTEYTFDDNGYLVA